MTTTTRPQASQWVRRKWKWIPATEVGGHTIPKHRVPKGEDTVRACVCPEHFRSTQDFRGVNEHGWIFKCKGRVENSKGEVEYSPHYFIAEGVNMNPGSGS